MEKSKELLKCDLVILAMRRGLYPKLFIYAFSVPIARSPLEIALGLHELSTFYARKDLLTALEVSLPGRRSAAQEKFHRCHVDPREFQARVQKIILSSCLEIPYVRVHSTKVPKYPGTRGFF